MCNFHDLGFPSVRLWQQRDEDFSLRLWYVQSSFLNESPTQRDGPWRPQRLPPSSIPKSAVLFSFKESYKAIVGYTVLCGHLLPPHTPYLSGERRCPRPQTTCFRHLMPVLIMEG
jgi:hypothetical protein